MLVKVKIDEFCPLEPNVSLYKFKIPDISIEWKGVMPAVTTKFNEDDTLDMKMFW